MKLALLILSLISSTAGFGQSPAPVPVDPKAKEIWEIYLNYQKRCTYLLDRLNTVSEQAADAMTHADYLASIKASRRIVSEIWTLGMTTHSSVRKQVAFRENWFADFITSNTEALQAYMKDQGNLADAITGGKPKDYIEGVSSAAERSRRHFIKNDKELTDAAATFKKRNGF